MRTTVRLEDWIERRLRELAFQQKKQFAQVVNETLQAGLSAMAREAKVTSAFKVEPERCGFRPGVDIEKLNQVLDDLEVDDFSMEASATRRRP